MAARRLPKSSTGESRLSMGASRGEAILFQTSSVHGELLRVKLQNKRVS